MQVAPGEGSGFFIDPSPLSSHNDNNRTTRIQVVPTDHALSLWERACASRRIGVCVARVPVETRSAASRRKHAGVWPEALAGTDTNRGNRHHLHALGSIMLLFWLLWVSWVLGGVAGFLCAAEGPRGRWLRMARVPAPERRPVWQRLYGVSVSPTRGDTLWLAAPGAVSRAGPP
jgi:hypothetical protein